MTIENESAYAELGMDPTLVEKLQVAQPQEIYAELAACPVNHSEDGLFVLGSTMGIDMIGRNRSVLGSGAIGPTGGAARPLVPLDIDGPEHTAYRKLLDPLFTPRKVAHLESDIRQLADQLIDGFIEKGGADVYDEFCAILPATIFLRLMGIDSSELQYFLDFKNDVLREIPGESLEDRAARFLNAAGRCYDYFNAALDAREALDDPGDDLLGRFLNAEVDGRRLARENILDICYLFMIAGLDTVAASLSCMLARLALHPDERRRITSNPAMWPSAIEEYLRWETPVPMATRTPVTDIVIGDEVIPAGTHIPVLWAAANLDPEKFNDPMTVNLERNPNPHYTFANGFHRCLGSHLARMELRTALDQFHRRIPDYELSVSEEELTYVSLPVRLVSPLPLAWNL
jgi:cytochrome P450